MVATHKALVPITQVEGHNNKSYVFSPTNGVFTRTTKVRKYDSHKILVPMTRVLVTFKCHRSKSVWQLLSATEVNFIKLLLKMKHDEKMS